MVKAMYNLWTKEKKNILFFSFELSRELLKRRIDSITAGAPYTKFRRGLVTLPERRRFTLNVSRQNKLGNWWEIITNENTDPSAAGGPNRLEYVYSKIMQLKPDIVAVDGFYLMKGSGDADWERMASLTRGFHQVMQSTGVCGWATTQLKKTSDEKNPKLKDLSYSWTFAQDADVVFLLSRDQEMTLNHEAALTYLI